MWKTVNSFSIVLFSGVLANRSILLASSIFLRSKVKKALPDLLIFIINKNLLFSIHYRHDSALGTNLDLGSWVQSIMELRRVFYDSILVFCLFYFHMSWRYSCISKTYENKISRRQGWNHRKPFLIPWYFALNSQGLS